MHGRYWELGSLGPAETQELAAKRLAALRAKEYGIRVAEKAKATLKPKAKQDSARAPSTRDRAMEFAKTVRAPKRGPKPLPPAPKPHASASTAPRGRAPPTQSAGPTDSSMPRLDGQVSVNTMVARHMDAARRVADIKAEVERWDLEDRELPEVPGMPKRRSPSPPRGRTKRRSPSPARRKPAPPASHAAASRTQGVEHSPAAEGGEQAVAGRDLAVERDAGESGDVHAEGSNRDPAVQQDAPSEDESNA